MLSGIVRLERNIAQIISNQTSPIDNKANPLYVLTPLLYFEAPHSFADARQQAIDNYLVNSSGKRWKFAIPNCVVRVHASDQPIDRFREKLFPDYQRLSVGDEAIDSVVRRMRERSVNHVKRRRIGTGANSVLERSMVHRPLDIDMSDIDRAAPSSAAVDDDHANLWHEPLMPNNAGGPAQPVTGGTSLADIRRMIASVPSTNAVGEYELVDGTRLAREDYEG